jgi:hypothetical protein
MHPAERIRNTPAVKISRFAAEGRAFGGQPQPPPRRPQQQEAADRAIETDQLQIQRQALEQVHVPVIREGRTDYSEGSRQAGRKNSATSSGAPCTWNTERLPHTGAAAGQRGRQYPVCDVDTRQLERRTVQSAGGKQQRTERALTEATQVAKPSAQGRCRQDAAGKHPGFAGAFQHHFAYQRDFVCAQAQCMALRCARDVATAGSAPARADGCHWLPAGVRSASFRRATSCGFAAAARAHRNAARASMQARRGGCPRVAVGAMRVSP